MTPFKVVVLDFTGVYEAQPLLLSRVDLFLDLKNLRGVRYVCSPEKLEELQGLLPNLGRTIAFLGGGECHHLSLLFLKRQRVPFTLVVLDSHFDFKEERDIIRCDSWLAYALSLEKVKRVVVLGCGRYRGRFRRLFFVNPPSTVFRRLLKGEWIYISVDKDVLADNPTKWDGGDWSFEELMGVLRSLPRRRIIGVDVCGEPDPHSFMKLKESERLNLAILEALLSPPRFSNRAHRKFTSGSYGQPRNTSLSQIHLLPWSEGVLP